jgi:hypothetical protein
VIIGFAAFDRRDKAIFEYAHSKADPSKVAAARINPYLADAVDVLLFKRGKPLCDVPEMVFGTKLVDDGHFILDREQRSELILKYPFTRRFIRPFTGGDEFLNGTERWVLWLEKALPTEIRHCPPILERIEAVREFRAASKKAPTVELAAKPSAIGEDRQPKDDYLLFPKVSSERRHYVPLGFLKADVIANGSSLIVPNAGLSEFGILSSAMHMAWMRYTGGRMKSDYQYSSQIVYNNFPWPDGTAEQCKRVEEKARAVLAAREPHLPPRGLGTLADLYDPLAMPAELARAHAELDRAVEKCYRSGPFHSDRERVEFLFALYETLTAPLLPATTKRRGRRSRNASATPRRSGQRTPFLPGQEL